MENQDHKDQTETKTTEQTSSTLKDSQQDNDKPSKHELDGNNNNNIEHKEKHSDSDSDVEMESDDEKNEKPQKSVTVSAPLLVPESAIKKDSDGHVSLDTEQLKNLTPLIIFINKRSGGQQGVKLLEKFQKLVNPVQVFDLGSGGPAPGLELFREVPTARILVAGGDGTAGWVLSAIDKMEHPSAQPVAVLPLGTGNDLARCLKWGGGYKGEKLLPILESVGKSEQVMLDRWSIQIAPRSSDGTVGEFQLKNIMNNYFSIGIDAQVALEFHEKREAHPEKFKNRTLNKINYTAIGASAMFGGKHLYKSMEVEVDGHKLELPHDMEGLVVLNLDSYMGGTNLWGSKTDDKFKPQSTEDGLFEVVSVTGTAHLAAIKIHLSTSKRLAQGKDIKVTITQATPAQVDGEPWSQEPSVIHIKHHNKVKMLKKVKSKSRFGL